MVSLVVIGPGVVDPLIVICTVAPVLLTAIGVMVTPAAESWKVCPATSEGSNQPVDVGVAGVISSRSLVFPLPSVPMRKSTPVVSFWV